MANYRPTKDDLALIRQSYRQQLTEAGNAQEAQECQNLLSLSDADLINTLEANTPHDPQTGQPIIWDTLNEMRNAWLRDQQGQ